MDRAVILMVDFDFIGNLGKALRETLDADPHSSIRLHYLQARIDEVVDDSKNLIRIVERNRPDLAIPILPSGLLKRDPLWFQSLSRITASTPIMVALESGEPDELLALLELGAADFITPPFKSLELFPRIWRLIGHVHQRRLLVRTLKEKVGLKQIVGESPAFRNVILKLPAIARCDAGVLISGETGTGKEMFARAIHYLSARSRRPFIPVNCGAIPEDLVENELFGHERGAYTDASRTKIGLIQEANTGTLFLDEVDSLTSVAQVKLLRFLQEKEFRQLGSAKTERADVRVIAAANVDLEKAVRTGKLRRDLYYRLNVIPLRLPPLRERHEDIALLASHFLARFTVEFNKLGLNFSAEALRKLALYEWPGNVRELEHVVERAVALCELKVIHASDLDLPGLVVSPNAPESFKKAKSRFIADFERAYIQELLIAHQGNVSRAAQAAQKDRRAFWHLIKKYQIDIFEFREGTYKTL